MVEFTEEPKSVIGAVVDLGWELCALFFLICGAIGLIGGYYYQIARLTPLGIAALVLAVYCEVRSVQKEMR